MLRSLIRNQMLTSCRGSSARRVGALRFSLLSLLCVVTAICGFLGFHAEWIRQRNVIRQNPRVYRPHYLGAFAEAPLTLRLFAEQGEANLEMIDSAPGELNHIRRMFPESNVYSEAEFLKSFQDAYHSRSEARQRSGDRGSQI